MRSRILSLLLAGLLVAGAGCGKKPADTATETGGQEQDQAATPAGKAASKAAAPKVKVIPANTVITVRTGQALSSKTSSAGEQFAASLAESIVIDGEEIAPQGASAVGRVVDAVPLGRFKGGARLQLKLESIEIDGRNYPVQSSSVARTAKGKGKRTATMVGGGAGLGALIGGLAGGGKGAAIGALAGGGAGTAGAAYTGNKNIVIPAETALSFKLLQPVEVR